MALVPHSQLTLTANTNHSPDPEGENYSSADNTLAEDNYDGDEEEYHGYEYYSDEHGHLESYEDLYEYYEYEYYEDEDGCHEHETYENEDKYYEYEHHEDGHWYYEYEYYEDEYEYYEYEYYKDGGEVEDEDQGGVDEDSGDEYYDEDEYDERGDYGDESEDEDEDQDEDDEDSEDEEGDYEDNEYNDELDAEESGDEQSEGLTEPQSRWATSYSLTSTGAESSNVVNVSLSQVQEYPDRLRREPGPNPESISNARGHEVTALEMDIDYPMQDVDSTPDDGME